MLVRVLLAAILAGVLSGVFVTAVQAFRVTPLILEAEVYENAAGDVPAHEHAAGTPAVHSHDHAHNRGEEQQADHDDSQVASWAPADGWERVLFTMLANILVGVAFSLIITGVILLTNSALTFQSGLVWGLAGFVTFVMAPNFGLSPELPGMPVADLGARQIWWLATVVLTGGALLIFAFKHQIFWMLAGLAMIVAPHIYGAPIPLNHETNVPANLAAEFVVATLVTSFLFWLVLGGLLGFLVERNQRAHEAEQSA